MGASFSGSMTSQVQQQIAKNFIAVDEQCCNGNGYVSKIIWKK